MTTSTYASDTLHHDAADGSPLRVALIVGSVRHGRFADALLPWLRQRLAGLDWADVDEVDLRDVVLAADFGSASPVSDRLHIADAFVILTPEYNHSFPASLKLAIDSHRAEWRRKPVSFVSYGAGSGGSRAVEQLRLVFPELEAMTTRNAVSIQNAWEHATEAGFTAPTQIDAALAATLEELQWWARALHAARSTRETGS